MKLRLKCLFKWCVCIIIILANLNLGAQAIAQPLDYTNVVLLSQNTLHSLTPTISASKLFRQAYENRYTWGAQFPGYTAAVELKQGKEDYKGHISLNPDMSVEVTGIDSEDARQTVENQIRMLIIHRRRVPFKVAHKNSTFQLGTTDKTGVVEIFEQEDQKESHYQVFHQQLVQVNRLLGQTAVTVDTLSSEVTPDGYLATRYRTTFRQPQTHQVLGQEESSDTYIQIGGYYVLKSQIIHDFEQNQQTTTELNFTDIKLLSTNG
ncbi:MAG: DUF3386 domain-containing protein [Stigonema ocellatum SAG 48.90 = DSM 106950]|nr:DUF3386 domain-containing protein [Stigonema ocellatum SAG 48.90 = DSM 106950]